MQKILHNYVKNSSYYLRDFPYMSFIFLILDKDFSI